MKNNYLKHLFTALLLLCTTMATAHDFEVGGIYYNILSETNKTVEVTFKGVNYFEDEYSASVVIPESVTYNGTTYSVTSIGKYAFSSCDGLTSIVIGNSVKSIGYYAFSSCDGLTSIEIPNSVTSIGEGAFSSCDGLTSIEIPNSVTSIGGDAFSSCDGLTSIEIPNSVTSIGDEAFSSCNGLTSITVSSGNTIYDSRNNCNAIIETATNTLVAGCKNSLIPSSVTSIGDRAFSSCDGLTSIEIPNSVTSIGKYAFSSCDGLTSIVIGNSVKSIGEGAFSSCTGLTSIEIGNSVKSIGYYAFSYCTGLTSIVIGNSVKSIGDRAFSSCNGLTSITVASGNTIYDSRNNCNAIIETATNTLVAGCKNSLIPSSVTSIGNDAFSSCNGLTSIEIPNSVISIGDYAFYSCSGLTSIEIPNSVTSIGDRAFYYCSGLTSIEIPNSVTSIGDEAFSGTAWYKNQPDGVVYAGKVLYKYKGTMPSNTSITIMDGTLGIADGSFSNCTGLTSIEIPSSVTSIGDDAFSSCNGLTSIEIPNSVTSIGEEAFAYCNGLTSIVIGNSVTSIGDRAFYGCDNLKTIINCSNLTITKGSTNNGYIAYYANEIINYPNGSIVDNFVFSTSGGKHTLVAYVDNDTDIVLPEDYNGESYVIGAKVFKNNSSITSIVIPNSVTSIGNYAFNGCTSLKNLRIEDGESTLSLGYNKYNYDGVKGLFYDCPLETLYIGRNLSYNTDNSSNYSPFYNKSTLTSVTIGNCVTRIGNCAFNGCTSLKNLHIEDGEGTLSLGYNGYYSDGYVKGLFYDCPLETLYIGRNLSYYTEDNSSSYSPFYNSSTLTSVTIGNSVTSIGKSSFSGCTALTSIEIPNSVTSIGSSAFSGCRNLTNVKFDFKVETEEKELYRVKMSSGYLNIGSYQESSGAISGANIVGYTDDNDQIFTIEKTNDGNYYLKSLSGYYIYCHQWHVDGHSSYKTALTFEETVNGEFYIKHTGGYFKVEEVDGVNYPFCDAPITAAATWTLEKAGTQIVSNGKSIESSAFYYCSGLGKVCINDLDAWCGIDFGSADANPLYYAGNLYLNGELLTELSIPAEIAEVKDYAFYNCNGVTNIDIVDGVKSIGNSAFYGCSDLETLYISNTIESIGNYAFAECNNIMDIKIGSKKAITASENIFSSDAYANAMLYVPNGRKFAYEKAAPWNKFYIVEMDFTGVEEVKAEGRNVKAIYDLQGRRVENPTKGIYIINGKKVFVK